MPGDRDTFPEGFVWGAATSAYQIEGSPLADGAGPSIWHRFAHTPGHVQGGDTGDVACDHYRRSASDVRLIADLGLGAYRFSVAWPRVMPEGRGRINEPGLDFYDRLVDELLRQNIRPMGTLYHWDLPAALDDRGGWLNPDVAGWFADYLEAVVRRLDDRVPWWVTLNEPWVVMNHGYLEGRFAPGHRNAFEGPIVTHNLLRAHAAGVAAYRACGRNEIGLVVNLEARRAASDDERDVAAARRADAYLNRQFLDPALLGQYPAEMEELFGDAWPGHTPGDVEALRQEIDFLGINYYTGSLIEEDPTAWPTRARAVPRPRCARTAMGWDVDPEGFSEIVQWAAQRYGRPLFITENGAAYYDPPVVPEDGVRDPLREAYFRDHLRALYQAIHHGADVRGYFAWSLLDNFEWADGYAKRFGLVHVDFETRTRTPKESARFYTRVIETSGAVLFE